MQRVSLSGVASRAIDAGGSLAGVMWISL